MKLVCLWEYEDLPKHDMFNPEVVLIFINII